MTEMVSGRLFRFNKILGLFTLLSLFFFAQLITGKNGLFAFVDFQRQVAEKQTVLTDLTEQRKALQQEVHYLRSDNLDVDRLEEEARLSLSLVAEDELVLMRDDF